MARGTQQAIGTVIGKNTLQVGTTTQLEDSVSNGGKEQEFVRYESSSGDESSGTVAKQYRIA